MSKSFTIGNKINEGLILTVFSPSLNETSKIKQVLGSITVLYVSKINQDKTCFNIFGQKCIK